MASKLKKFFAFVKKYKVLIIFWITVTAWAIGNAVISVFLGNKNADAAIKEIADRRIKENEKITEDIDKFIDDNPVPPKL